MKVAFISRASLFSDRGGDTIQIVNTATNLRILGIDVDIFLADQKPDYSKYDLLHFFNIIRPDDILPHINRSLIPFVVSTIFVDYSEYEKKARQGPSAFLFRFLSANLIEYLKALARFAVNGVKIKSGYFLFHGQKKSIRKIIRMTQILLPNSKSEYDRLLNAYDIHKKYKVIPNGIDKNLFINGTGEIERDARLILCVARIEGRKNQLNLIRALTNSHYRLVLVGAVATNQLDYYKECKKAAGPNIEFIDFIEQNLLLDYYRKAKVHVLPSWFETTGLSSLEAAAMGCNIVITRKGDAYEYFENDAYYCDPESPDSIFRAVEQAAQNEIANGLSSKVLNQFTWQIAAKKTMEAYADLLDNKP
ncbi:MAG TPA: glycosyltransferase family 4 protein [Puia sp.]|nr:glycosyltransferase family 4 protein [Puia sp.]